MMGPEVLLGGKTRFAIIEALAGARRPVSAYQIALTKGLDPAATYRCLAEFSKFGVVERIIKDGGQASYKLSRGPGAAAATFMRSLVEKKIETDDLDEWLSPQLQAERMSTLVSIDKGKIAKSSFARTKAVNVNRLMSRRTPGELAALVESSKIAFSRLFTEEDGVFTLRV